MILFGFQTHFTYCKAVYLKPKFCESVLDKPMTRRTILCITAWRANDQVTIGPQNVQVQEC